MRTGRFDAASNDASRAGPPRLVLRFAVATCIGLALAAGAILLVVRHFDTVQAERAATAQARVLASAVLRGPLTAADFDRPVGDRRRAALDGLFESHILREGVLVAKLYSADGTVTYSTDHRLIGTRTQDLAPLGEARTGTVRGDVATVPASQPGAEPRKALRVYAPVAVPGGTGVVALFEDYEPIAQGSASRVPAGRRHLRDRSRP